MIATANPPPASITILLAGVGGQGVVLAGDVIAEAAFLAGFEVKKSENHGLSRRFGSVSCQVRLGRQALSPLRGHGGVDLLLALEVHEGLRNLPFLKPSGTALVNRLEIATVGARSSAAPLQGGNTPVGRHLAARFSRGQARPAVASAPALRNGETSALSHGSAFLLRLQNGSFPRIVWLDGTEATHEMDCPKSLNIYMVGAVAGLLPILEKQWPQAIRRLLPEHHFRINMEVFRAGTSAARTVLQC